jgi:hypothetical protein
VRKKDPAGYAGSSSDRAHRVNASAFMAVRKAAPDYRHCLVDRADPLAYDFLTEELRLLVIDSCCRHRDEDRAVGEMSDFDDVGLDGQSGGCGVRHLPAPAAPGTGMRLGVAITASIMTVVAVICWTPLLGLFLGGLAQDELGVDGKACSMTLKPLPSLWGNARPMLSQ